MRISDWSSDVCSSDLRCLLRLGDIVEIAGVIFDILDLRVDIERVLADFLAGIDDGGNFQPTKVRDPAVLERIRGSGAANEAVPARAQIMARHFLRLARTERAARGAGVWRTYKISWVA